MTLSIPNFLTALRKIRYPELVLLLALSSYFASLSLNKVHLFGFIGLTIFSLILFVISTIKSRNIIFDTLSLLAMAVCLGLLQFYNYMPSAYLWLMFCYRLFLINKKFILPLFIASVALIGFILLSLYNQDFLMVLSTDERKIADNIAVSFTTLAIFQQMWYLINRIQSYKNKFVEQNSRLTTFVSVTNKLTRFLPPQVWQPIVKTNSTVQVINQRRKLTIFFSDIVGFTELSDKISPDHLANILNTYFDSMTKITKKYGATLDKFIGDGLLCFFGDEANNNERNDALRCIAMAIEMRREMQVLRQQWRLLGFDGLQIRMGINTGYCYVGNFGSSNRMTYTLIGKEANFASRLESAAKPNQILISESTYNLISHKHTCRMVGQVQLKGLQQVANVWEVLDPQQGDNNDKWVDYQLDGFNLHLNFNDIRNYDKRTIINHLNHALDLVDKKMD